MMMRRSTVRVERRPLSGAGLSFAGWVVRIAATTAVLGAGNWVEALRHWISPDPAPWDSGFDLYETAATSVTAFVIHLGGGGPVIAIAIVYGFIAFLIATSALIVGADGVWVAGARSGESVTCLILAVGAVTAWAGIHPIYWETPTAFCSVLALCLLTCTFVGMQVVTTRTVKASPSLPMPAAASPDRRGDSQ